MVLGRKSNAAIFSRGARVQTVPIQRRELRRWMQRNRNNHTIQSLADAACQTFGFKPTSYIYDLAYEVLATDMHDQMDQFINKA